MAKVIPFPQTPKKMTQLVDEILDSRLTHRDPEVLQCLKKELKGLVEQYFTGEEFAATLILPADLNSVQFQTIEQNFQKIFQEHNEQMIRKTNALFLDLCLTRMTVCELQQQNKPSQDN